MTKRPWAPGPWPYDPMDVMADFVIPDDRNLIANEKLASKSPEMAELLIEIIDFKTEVESTPLGLKAEKLYDGFNDLVDKTKELLKEIGYEEKE